MNFDDYQKAWQAQDSRPNVALNADALLEEVRRKQQGFRRMIFWRDVREVGVAAVLVPVFIHSGLTVSWTLHLAAFGCFVVGADIAEENLKIAKTSYALRNPPRFVASDCCHLPFPDGSFDAVTIAFGNRNVASLPALYAEMRRVAKTGGRVVSLEITGPTAPVLREAFFLYFTHVPPLLARLLGADPGAYTYLPDSVRRYPAPAAVAAIMRDAGLREVTVHPLMLGAVVLHRGIAG